MDGALSHAMLIHFLEGLKLYDQAPTKTQDLKAWVSFPGWQYSQNVFKYHCWLKLLWYMTPLGQLAALQLELP